MADNTNISILSKTDLLNELSQLIEQSKQEVAVQANSAVTILFWQIGNRINQDILQNKRAEYGKQIVSTVATQLENKYGRNFEIKNLRRMMQFAAQFTDFQIVVTLSRQLSWSHCLALLPIKKHESQLFYANQVMDNSMSVRELKRQIALKAFERTSIADAQIMKGTQIPFNTFKDPYILDLLGLQNTFLEKDLENAILHDLETFIL
jgi:hypothetical protein